MTTCLPAFNLFKDSQQYQSYDAFSMALKDKTTGTYLSLTGAEVTMDFREGSEDGTIIKELAIGNGITITNDGTKDLINFASFSLDVPGIIYYDLRINYTNVSKVKYYVPGKVTIKPSVTKQDS